MVEVHDDVKIPMRDGIDLSATLVLPAGGSQSPRRGSPSPAGAGQWPAIFNLDPYRKDDWSAGWDRSLGTYLAEHGFAYCRADVRGTGSSGGVALDEYADAETRDGYEAVEWLARQPWSNGRVGMWGLSYGGFTSLQVAALRPPALRAIVAIQATDDRYTDDVHYVGGAMTVSELSQYAVSQVATNALPPQPEAWGDRWRERWLERLEATPPWLVGWMRDQRDSRAWRRGSLAPDYGRIKAAVLQLAGWMDEYVDAALRIQARCTSAVARRTIVGPWVHGLPDHAYPGPNMDWLGELVRWFGRFLRDESSPTARDVPLTWFQRDPTRPQRFPERLEGSWRETAGWPPVDRARLELALDGGEEAARGHLAMTGSADARPPTSTPGSDELQHHPTAGARGGALCWGAGHRPNGLAADLRVEEAWSLVYSSDALDEAIEILGAPVAVLHVASTQPVAHLVARLGDVAQDGSVEQVCEGILNLTHRDSHLEPSPLEPGHVYEVRLALRSAGYRFPAGHRIRLSLASAHWPVIWPSPGATTLTVHRGRGHASHLELPLAPADAGPATSPSLSDPPAALPIFGSEVSEPPTWTILGDPLAGTVTVSTFEAGTSTLPDGRSTLFGSEALAMTASEREPGTGRSENTCVYRLSRDGLVVEVVAEGVTVASTEAFDVAGGLRVELDGQPFFERRWQERIPRDLL